MPTTIPWRRLLVVAVVLGAAPGCTLEVFDQRARLVRCDKGIADPGYRCDDGDIGSSEGCSLTCPLERCGNAVINPGEVCDDGNTVTGDGCSADCRSLEVCGNRIVDVARGEVCDDGNTIGGDGCEADCTRSP